MTLEDFEKQLAEEQEPKSHSSKRRDRESEREREERHQRHHHHHHRSSRHREDRHNDGAHRSKRRKHGEDEENLPEHVSHRSRSSDRDKTQRLAELETKRPSLGGVKRDSWMEAPSSIDIDYVQRRRQEASPPKSGSLGADFEMKIHKAELNHHLKDLKAGKELDDLTHTSATGEMDYTFGDSGSQWRMTRLKAVYRQAKDSSTPVDEVALERYGSLENFDAAREEEIELGRRETYGKDYVGKDRPSGDLFQERKLEAGVGGKASDFTDQQGPYDHIAETIMAPSNIKAEIGPKLDQTALNRMKAQLMKAQLRKASNLAELQKRYDEALAVSTTADPTVVTLSAMDNRMLSSAPRNEVKTVSNRRGAERGNVEENEDMSIDDMVREERRTRHQAGGEAQRFAERIAKDGKFDNDLEYMDENAAKLAKRVHKSEANLKNMSINEYQKMNKILESCPLCHHEDTETPPIAPVVSLATRTYLTLPTEPELSSFGAMVVPIEHRTNLIECDDDEWEEIRNFMKSLTRFYHDQGRDVIFYENAAHPHRKPHAGMVAVALPYGQGDTAPAFFTEAFLTAEDEWSQHKKVIDTLAKSKQGLGKLAFRRTLVKEMPYFHVWFEMDGGLGHVVEDANRWPKGDLFAREIIGGILGSEPDVIKRQGRWNRGHDSRVEGFRKKWKKFDWTRVLTDG